MFSPVWFTFEMLHCGLVAGEKVLYVELTKDISTNIADLLLISGTKHGVVFVDESHFDKDRVDKVVIFNKLSNHPYRLSCGLVGYRIFTFLMWRRHWNS